MTTTDTLYASVAAGVTRIRARIAATAERAGRNADAVTLVAVSKTFSAETVAAAVAAGVAHIGENRVQEAEAKRSLLDPAGIACAWHLLGHLQSNKVKTALRAFDILQSVDSMRLAEIISRTATRPVDILLEVNVAGEVSKFGFAPEQAASAVERIARLPHLRPRGLMTVAPMATDAEDVRPVFRRLRELRDATGLVELSMGMSHDFEVAIEEGATMVRIGRAIFGERGPAGGTH